MKTVVVQEKVTVWQDVIYEIEDDVDISTKAKLKEVIENGDYWGRTTKTVYGETEDLLERDYATAELEGEMYPEDDNEEIAL